MTNLVVDLRRVLVRIIGREQASRGLIARLKQQLHDALAECAEAKVRASEAELRMEEAEEEQARLAQQLLELNTQLHQASTELTHVRGLLADTSARLLDAERANAELVANAEREREKLRTAFEAELEAAKAAFRSERELLESAFCAERTRLEREAEAALGKITLITLIRGGRGRTRYLAGGAAVSMSFSLVTVCVVASQGPASARERIGGVGGAACGGACAAAAAGGILRLLDPSENLSTYLCLNTDIYAQMYSLHFR